MLDGINGWFPETQDESRCPEFGLSRDAPLVLPIVKKNILVRIWDRLYFGERFAWWKLWLELKCLKQSLCRLILGRSFIRNR